MIEYTDLAIVVLNLIILANLFEVVLRIDRLERKIKGEMFRSAFEKIKTR